MIILHKGQRCDGKGEVKGFLTKMWGTYHIILENDENTAYQVIEESIEPCFPPEEDGVKIIDVSQDGQNYINPLGIDVNINEFNIGTAKKDIVDQVMKIVELNDYHGRKNNYEEILDTVLYRNNLTISTEEKEEILKVIYSVA